jgi:hypothetical protein
MWGMRDHWLECCCVVEVWYLGLDHVDMEGLLNQKISTILYLLYVVYLVYRL